jgi:hypothetical protein
MALLMDSMKWPAADWRPPLHLVRANSQMVNLLELAIRLVWKETDSKFVSRRAKRQTTELPVKLQTQALQRDLFLRWANLQERLHLVQDSPVPLGRAHRCSQYPDPSAFSRGTPVARKCNRAAHCVDHPISAQYHLPRNRRGLVGCDNKCSRSQRKRASRARPFLIAAADKYRCLPRRTAD